MNTVEQLINNWNPRSKMDLEEKLSNHKIMFAYHSGNIENPEITYHQTREIFENGAVINFTGSLRTLYEIQNQEICYKFLVDKIIEKEELSSDLILQVHKRLTQGTYDEHRWEKGERPGAFKKGDYCVGDNQGALPEDVADEIEEICEELQGFNGSPKQIYKAAAYLHCKFENIHPFADGNGRVGRTLMNYFLMTHDCPPLIVYNDTKQTYYEAIRDYDQTGDLNPFVEYMMASLERSWERNIPKQKLYEYEDIEL